MNLREVIEYWSSKPQELKPLTLDGNIRSPRSNTDFHFNTSIRRLKFNPYKCNNLRILMQIHKNPKLPGSGMNTRILRSLLPYTPMYYKEQYVFNDPRDAQYGAEYALACLLPVLLGRKVPWEEVSYYATLMDDEIKLFCETYCEKRPDLWWPCHINDHEDEFSNTRKRLFYPGELLGLILKALSKRSTSSEIQKFILTKKDADKSKLRNTVSTILNELRKEGVIEKMGPVWGLRDPIPSKYEKYLR